MSEVSHYYTADGGPLSKDAESLLLSLKLAEVLGMENFFLAARDLTLLGKIFHDFKRLDIEHAELRYASTKEIASLQRSNRRLELALREERNVHRGIYFGAGILFAALAIIAFFLCMSALGVATTPSDPIEDETTTTHSTTF